MKKITLSIVAFACMATTGVNAQSIYDASKLTDRDLSGTARYVGMGGAMGALGGDISTMSTNPAGIGIYRSNDINGTVGWSFFGTDTKFDGSTFNNERNRFALNNMGFVLSNKVGNHTALRYVNFGFNYQRVKSFNRDMSMSGFINTTSDGYPISQLEQMAHQANHLPGYDLGAGGVFSNPNVGWLSALGWNGYLLDQDENTLEYFPMPYDRPEINFSSEESGKVDQYDFNVSFNINERVFLGLTLGVYDVTYNKYTYYDEDYGDTQGYGIASDNQISGSGFDFKLGAIVRPFEDSPFRLGFAVHSPTFYNLTYYTRAYLGADVILDNESNFFEVDTYQKLGGDMRREFNMNTPWKFNLSTGYTVGTNLALGAEYEFQDYSSIRFKEGSAMSYENDEISNHLKGVHTLKLGAEYKLVPEFAIRAGYNMSTAPHNGSASKNLAINSINTDTDYANRKTVNNFSLGFGYRGRSFYADMAYLYSTYKEDFYAFNNIYLLPSEVKNNNHKVMLTMGVRF